MPWNQREFDDACRRFRGYFADFESFDHPGERYVEEERAYKDELADLYTVRVRPLLTKPDSDFFRAYVEILKEQNFVGWRFCGVLRDLPEDASSEFGRILKLVIESDVDSSSITTYGKSAPELLLSVHGPEYRPPNAEIRTLLSLLLMLHNSSNFMCGTFTYWNRFSQLLLGEDLIEWGSQITGTEFVECQEFAKRVSDALVTAGLPPTDMIDVQSFLYIVSDPDELDRLAVSRTDWNQDAFATSIAAFKQRYQGFENFSRKNCGEQYARLQREFKQEFMKRYNARLKPLVEGDPVEFLDAYAEIIHAETDAARPVGDEGWRVLTNEVPSEEKAQLGSMLQSLINAGATKANKAEWDSIVAEYSENAMQLSDGHDSGTSSREMRQKLRESATLLLSLRWPKKYVHATRGVWNVAANKFLGCELIKTSDVISSRLLEDAIWGFTRLVNFGLKEAGLAPRDKADKFDTQSFLWSVYDESKSATEPDSSEDAGIGPSASVVTQQLDLATIIQAIRSEGMRIDEATVRQYHFSMRTRGFIILAGPSGVGKTWLTRLYANVLSAEYLLAPVAPNWSTNEDLLGFFNPVDGNFHATAFLDFIDRAAESWDHLGAEAPEFHLVLDEMNLARVEHYFSLFLSLMEMRRETDLPETRLTGDRIVRVPPNLKFAGTVNMDETTHGFADKVFDRAQLIELSISSDAAREHVSERIGDSAAAEVLLDLWDRMALACPVGFRVLDDIADYLELAEEGGVDWRVALDEQIVSKLLPKLRGLDPEVADALRRIDTRVDSEFPRASAKCKSMLQRVQATDVVSFF